MSSLVTGAARDPDAAMRGFQKLEESEDMKDGRDQSPHDCHQDLVALVQEHCAAMQVALAERCDNLLQVVISQTHSNGSSTIPREAASDGLRQAATKHLPETPPMPQVVGRRSKLSSGALQTNGLVADGSGDPAQKNSSATMSPKEAASRRAQRPARPKGAARQMSVLELPEPEYKRSSKEEHQLQLQQRVLHQHHQEVRAGIFADGDAMKQRLREAMSQPVYDVCNFYWTEGYCQALARSQFFENLTLGVIALNALWISIDVDLNNATIPVQADVGFQVVDNLFCIYFVFEWLVRFGAFQNKANCLRDFWFVFDTILCIFMVGETWVLSFIMLVAGTTSQGEFADASLLKGLRLFRLIRMARVIRLLNALPELMVVIKGMAVATRAVSCTVLLMMLIIYIFAVAFRQLSDDTEFGNEFWPNVPLTMRYLLLQGTAPDLYIPAVAIWEESVIYALIFFFYILVVSITVMNMLVGVLVGVVNTVAAVEKEQLMVNYVQSNLGYLLESKKIDKDNNGKISRDEFEELICLPEAMRSLTQMGVDVVGLVDLADFIFQDQYQNTDDHEIPFSDFMELIMQLRGSNQATVKDIVDLRKFITQEINKHYPHHYNYYRDHLPTVPVETIEEVPSPMARLDENLERAPPKSQSDEKQSDDEQQPSLEGSTAKKKKFYKKANKQ